MEPSRNPCLACDIAKHVFETFESVGFAPAVQDERGRNIRSAFDDRGSPLNEVVRLMGWRVSNFVHKPLISHEAEPSRRRNDYVSAADDRACAAMVASMLSRSFRLSPI